MIIQLTEENKREIKAATKPLRDEEKKLTDQLLALPDNHFVIADEIKKPQSKEAIALMKRINDCTKRRWNAIRSVYEDIENRHYEKIGTSQQSILNDAFNQTDTILEYMVMAVDLLGNSNTTMPPWEIHEKLEPVQSLIYGTGIIDRIRTSGGDVTKLNAQQIIHLIQRELDRHYEMLNTQNKKTLAEYVKKAVTDIMDEHPEIEDAHYWIVTKDSIFSTIGTLAVKKNKLNKGGKKAYLKIGNVKYSFDKASYNEIKKHIGVNAVNLYIMTNHEFTMNPNDKNEVSFPTIPFLELCGKGNVITNPKTLATEIERIRYGELTSLRSMAISLDKKDKDNLPDLYDQNLYSRTRINKDRIIITFTPEYAAYLRSVKTKGYIPTDILRGSGNQLNALAIKFKLWDNATQYNNLLSGQGKIISVRTLLKETSLPTYEDLGAYKSRWKERIKARFEEALKNALNSDLFTGGDYCKAKSQPLTPQEREEASRDFHAWEALYISYDIKDQQFKEMLKEMAEKNKEKRIEASERRKRKEAIDTAKALEKLEKN